MSKTSTEVKRRYNEKTYSNYIAALRKEDFEKIEEARGEMSRAQFLLMLFKEHQEANKKEYQEANKDNETGVAEDSI